MVKKAKVYGKQKITNLTADLQKFSLASPAKGIVCILCFIFNCLRLLKENLPEAMLSVNCHPIQAAHVNMQGKMSQARLLLTRRMSNP